MVSLWRSVLIKFRDRYPGINCPVETLVMLILLNGSDYTDKYSQLGPISVWDSFRNGGHRILYPNSQIRTPETPRIEEKEAYDDNCNGNNKTTDQTVIMDAFSYGEPQQRYSLCLTESKIFNFISFAYHNCMLPKKERDAQNRSSSSSSSSSPHPPSMKHVRKEANRRDQTRKDPRKYDIPEDDDEIYARIRRMMWTLDYWLNGSKKSQPFLDPLQKHPESKESMWGWEEDARTEREKEREGEGHAAARLKNKNHPGQDTLTIRKSKRVHR